MVKVHGLTRHEPKHEGGNSNMSRFEALSLATKMRRYELLCEGSPDHFTIDWVLKMADHIMSATVEDIDNLIFRYGN